MYLQSIINRLQILGEAMSQHGTRIIVTLAVLIAGLLIARWIEKGIRNSLRRWMPTAAFVTPVCRVAYIILVMMVFAAAMTEFGAKPINVIRFLSIITLVVMGLIIFLRPFFPTMPFKIGDTIKAGNLLGVVEGMSFLNTQLRTFGGKSFFVPNRKIIDDIVINYDLTPTRRVKINVRIRYDQDLQKAKTVLESLMPADERVKATPSPVVRVLNLASSCVELGGRCWVDNEKWWGARCDLIEQTKYRFDKEGIEFAFPQLQLHYNPGQAQKTARGENLTIGDVETLNQ